MKLRDLSKDSKTHKGITTISIRVGLHFRLQQGEKAKKKILRFIFPEQRLNYNR
jgi:hypothetical protein